jgi:hypothetical protein
MAWPAWMAVDSSLSPSHPISLGDPPTIAPQCLFVEGRGVALALSIGVGQIGLIIARRRQRRYNVYGPKPTWTTWRWENDQENHIS